MGPTLRFIVHPRLLGRRVDVADDSLPTVGVVDVLDRHPLLALRAIVFQSLNLHRKGAGELFRRPLGAVLELRLTRRFERCSAGSRAKMLDNRGGCARKYLQRISKL
jgi:hypothetical protein